MIQVTELGYMGFAVRDLPAWRDFARDILALEVFDEGEADRCYLRMDYWHHRFALHADGDDDLAYLGFRVAGPTEFEGMQQQLREAGITFRLGSNDEAAERRVLELMKLNDPDGHAIEIFHGPLVQPGKPFHPGRRMHGRFVTDSGGCGHCIIRQRDPAAATRFYRALGMRGGIEYKIDLGQGVAAITFMHCNTRDHSVAWGVGSPQRKLNHVMIEVDNLDDVGLTHDLVRAANIPINIQLGKHANDHMFSFYFTNPSGFMFEYGWGARAASHQSEYYTRDLFGHGLEKGGF